MRITSIKKKVTALAITLVGFATFQIVSAQNYATCAPIGGGTGSILIGMADNTLHSMDLTTGKATQIANATSAVGAGNGINALAVNYINNLAYFVANNPANNGNTSIYWLDLVTGATGTLTTNISSASPAGANIALNAGGRGVASGSGFFYNGFYFLGLEKTNGGTQSQLWEIPVGPTGKTISANATLFNTDVLDWGDIVITGNPGSELVHSFSNVPLQYTRYNAAGTSVNTTATTVNYQSALDRSGNVFVATTTGTLQLQQYNVVTPGLTGSVIPINTNGTTAFTGTINDAASCVPATGTIGDTLFYDLNANGTQDAGDNGISSVTVELINDLNNNGIADAGEAVLGNTATNASGKYLFSNIQPGNYVVRPVTASGPLVGLTQTNPGTTAGLKPATIATVGAADLTADFGYRVNADLQITKTNGVTTVNAAGTTSYTIVVTNAGPDTVLNAVVKDPAVSGLTKTSATCTGAQCPAAGLVTTALLEGAGVVIPSLASGASVTLTVGANVTATSGSVANTATITGPLGHNDPTPANNSVTDTDTVQPIANLSITKTDGASSVNAGGTTTYTVVVSNAGPSAADNAIFTDPSITGLTVSSVTCATPTGGAACPTAANTTIALMQGAGIVIPTLPSGGSVSFTVIGTVAGNAPSPLVNAAKVITPVGVSDPDDPTRTGAGNNGANDSNTVVPQADLVISKTDGTSSVNAGGTTTYTIVVTNNGPSAANNTVVTDPAVAGLAKTGVTCGSVTGSAVCPTAANTTVALLEAAGIVIPTLPSGGSVTFTVTANVTAASGSVTNTATVTPPVGVNDPTPGNNSSPDTNTVNPRADLAITKTDGAISVNAGGTTSYTIVVTNNGPSSADNAIFTDPAITGLNVSSVTCGTPVGGAACPTAANTTVALMQGAGIVIPTLPSGGSVTFTVNASVTAGSGSLTNTATIAPPAGTSDPTPGNNSAPDTNTVNPRADLSITKTDGITTVNAGGITTYTVVVSNAGPSAADGAIFTDPSITGLSISSVTCGTPTGGAACPTAANTTVALMQGAGIIIPTLPSGGSVSFTVTGTVAGNAGSPLTNVANIAPPAGVTEINAGNNTANDADTVQPVADIGVVKTGPASVIQGGTAAYTIVVSNAGPSAANNTIFTDPAVAGLNVSSVTCATPTGGAACPTAANTTVALMQGAGIVIPTLPSGGSVTFTERDCHRSRINYQHRRCPATVRDQ